MSTYDILIVGGGCVGCSVARSLAEKSNLDIAVVEKEYHFAIHQSGRNSGVLHPGFNYEPGSLKARFSTEGTKRMKSYADENDIPIKEIGVVVVAQTDAEEIRLNNLQEQAKANGVKTELLQTPAEINEHEPHVTGQAALFAPEAASIDAQQYVYALARNASDEGVDFYMGSRVEDIVPSGNGFVVHTTTGQLAARYVVNAAGLHADHLAHKLGIGEDYRIIPFRGEYYELVPEKRYLVNSMIYPTPDPELPFLGVHYTRRTDDKVIVGPNAVLAFGREAYKNTQFDLEDLSEILRYRGFRHLMMSSKMLKVAWNELNKSYRKEKFVAAAQRLLPAVQDDDFRKSYSGIRAQLVSADGSLVKDPLFEHGQNSTHVLNAVSPGLTCSLPFGDYLSDAILENFDA
jgi:L-2-hydroxyglutarate oxidase